MEIPRYVAFATGPTGGNPAGVIRDATAADAAETLAVAAEVGCSETAFAVPRPDGEPDVRYCSPEAEVSFRGHATPATAVARAGVHCTGEPALHAPAGPAGRRGQSAGAAR